MKQMKLIHFEHALPPMAEMGLEHVVAPVLRVMVGGGLKTALATLDGDALARAFNALAHGASSRACRRLVAVLQASDKELLEWEDDPKVAEKAIRAAALLDTKEVQAALSDFFGSWGLSLKRSPDSSAHEEIRETTEVPNPDGSSAPFSSPS